MIPHQLVASAGVAIAKRAATGGGGENNTYMLSTAGMFAVFFTTIAFIPAFLFIGYTLNTIYPTLAMVEDPKPSAYEPVSLADDAEAAPSSRPAGESDMVTASLRKLNRLLFSVAGWRANFRGIMCAVAVNLATAMVGGIFSAIPFVPSFVGTLLATLAMIQLHTAWVHIVIAAPNPLPFWKRLPEFRKTFEATVIPVVVYWVASTVVSRLPFILGGLFGLQLWDPANPQQIPEYHSGTGWKTTVVGIATIAVIYLVVIPSYVVLVRVQASLLPPGEDPIVSFDRSFDGTVDPAIVGGKGYVSWRNALKTFPRSSWIRLYVLYFKAFLVTLGVYLAFAAIILPEVILMSRRVEPSN